MSQESLQTCSSFCRLVTGLAVEPNLPPIPPIHGLPDLVAINRVCFNRGSLDSLLVLIVWQFSFITSRTIRQHNALSAVTCASPRTHSRCKHSPPYVKVSRAHFGSNSSPKARHVLASSDFGFDSSLHVFRPITFQPRDVRRVLHLGSFPPCTTLVPSFEAAL